MKNPALTVYLLQWRKHLGLTQVELGDRMGRTSGQISELETGKRQWDLEILREAADALGVHWIMLLGRPEDELALEAALRRIPRDRRDLARRMLETIAIPEPEKKKIG